MSQFPNLLSPITIGPVEIRNRIVSTGHHTHLADKVPTDDLVAYHEARAQGGTGLIIMEVASVHPSAYFSPDVIEAYKTESIEGYRQVAEACHRSGATLFAQLFHPGREIKMSPDGTTPVAHAPSAVANERFHLTPKPMHKRLIREVINGYGLSAANLQAAGLDGVEIVASHGYLPAQFLNASVNSRQDRYGGSFSNRLRFVREIIAAIRRSADNLAVGLRISANEMEPAGLKPQDTSAICEALDQDLDYFNLVAGSSATLGGSTHIASAMGVEHGYVAPFSEIVKQRVSKPVMVTGRINQPQVAEEILSNGQADLCGMTRALICDPQMPKKTANDTLDEIRACIGCNQACIGHSHTGHPISCIQYPESGRELRYANKPRTSRPRKVLVAGGGPGGLKAATTAAQCGHEVILCEKSAKLGGQALLAQLLPRRAEFGTIVQNLQGEAERAGVKIMTNTSVTRQTVLDLGSHNVIVATGAEPLIPDLPGSEEAHVVSAWDVLTGNANVGHSVVIADWRCDWIGMGLAERFARDGCSVRLCVNGYMPGQTLQQYVRDPWWGELQKLGVEITPLMRLYGVDNDTVYFQHTTNDEAVLYENVETLVLSLGHVSQNALDEELMGLNCQITSIGDCVSPRTAEEAVLEGLQSAIAIG